MKEFNIKDSKIKKLSKKSKGLVQVLISQRKSIFLVISVFQGFKCFYMDIHYKNVILHMRNKGLE